MKLLLTSAGIKNQSIFNALQGLIGKLVQDVRVGFITTAKNNREVSPAEALIKQIAQLDKWGYVNYKLVDPSHDTNWEQIIEEVDLVVIAGGNTFHLLNESRMNGFVDWLRANVDKKVYMGTSAGSILLTPYIGVAPLDNGDENTPGISDLRGVSLVDFEVSPHTPEDVSYKTLEEYAKQSPRTVYALDDQSAVLVTNSEHTVISEGVWRKYN